MTRIVVFCDGTWNSPDISEPTHVVKLKEQLVHDPAKGQVVVYFTGVGTDTRFDSRIGKLLNKYGGGAFGWGLDSKVKQAYQFIAQAYQDGDEIYLFGFSRGGYTARSVAGMIRKCGIVRDTSAAGINAAFELYQKGGARNHPDKPHIQAARQAMSPDFATSDRDQEARGDDSKRVKIAYIGVWDTVGAKGVPVALLGWAAVLWNRRHQFHDMALSSLVRSARHAVALDERRLFYKPALWDNLDGEEGLNKGDTSALRPYQQLWFIGHHGTVGGSDSQQALAAIAQDWVFQGAGRLALKPGAGVPTSPADPMAPYKRPKGKLLKAWRKGPRLDQNLHGSVRERVMADAEYRPGSLRRLMGFAR